MLRVGLTGGTGAGKSTVAALLAGRGAVVVDADALAREVLAPGSGGLAEVASRFGTAVLQADGSLDRAALARVAFADERSRRDLEGITHPRIAARTAELFAQSAPDAILVHDVPLLVEKQMGAGYHLVVVVDAPVEERVRRLGLRGMAPDDARARIAAQAGEAARRAAADVWLVNDGDDVALEAAVERLWSQRLVSFEANVRTRTRVRGADAPALVPAEPTWPAQAERLAQRVARAAGERARGVQHIGSTSLPGIAAKDVIDLQLAVDSLTDADAVTAALADAGFPPAEAHEGWDHVHPALGGSPGGTWPKRFHGGADPGRVVHLHVREHGSPGWRAALLMRDWWRAEPAARHEYEQAKLRLAATSPTTSAYAEAKEPFFAAAVPRAAAWAERTGWAPPG